MQKFDKVIIGGGIAGAACGHELAKNGDNDFLLVEAKGNLGGRMATQKLPNGDLINLGGEFIDREHHNMRNLATEVGVELAEVYSGNPSLRLDYDNIDHKQFDSLIRRLEIDVKLTDADHIGYLQNLPLKNYLREVGLTGSPRQALLDYSELMYGTSQLSAYCLIELGFHKGKFLPDGASQFMIRGGSQSLVEQIGERFSANIKLNEPVTGIERTAAGNYEITLNSGRVIACEQVIIAAPLTAVRNIDLSRTDLPSDYIETINKARYGQNNKVIPYYAGQHEITSDFIFSASLKAQIWENAKGTNKAGLAVSIFLAADPNDWWSQNNAQFKEEFPNLPSPSAVYVKNWSQDPYAQGSYHVGTQDPTKVAKLRDPFEGINFAGEHVGGSGYMEDAARSGLRIGSKKSAL